MQSSAHNDQAKQDYNEKYFRPSKLPSINSIDLDDFITKYNSDNPINSSPPLDFTANPDTTVLHFFSILQEANQTQSNQVGCGTIGYELWPYPIAYLFLSKNLKGHMSYQQFLKLFKNISHINLIKMIPLPNESSTDNAVNYLIEIETIEGNCFCYYLVYLDVIQEDSHYSINSIELIREDFFCAPYHGWQHDAEFKVEIMYGNWCNLIAKQYPALENDYIKQILIDGTDGKQYLFEFVKLTNGTDVEINQYVKSMNGQWERVTIDPYKCLKQSDT